MKIIPAILTNDISELTALEAKAEGTVDRVQIDIIDTKFANNSTVDPTVLKNISTILHLDFHLMVKDPIEWIEHCVLAEESRIIAQIEYMPSQVDFVNKVISFKSKAGLAVDLGTEIEKLDKNVLPKLAVVLLMSVRAGFGGQEFDLAVWEKIDALNKLRTSLKLNFKICVDGGITREIARQMSAKGVDEAAVGMRIFQGDLKQNLSLFEGGE